MESRFFRRVESLLFSIPARRARPASVGFNLLKTLVQSLSMWMVFLLIGPLVVLRLESLLVGHIWLPSHFSSPFFLAILLFVLGWIIAWTSAWFLVRHGDGTPLPLDATNKLVVQGPYCWIRNPMAFSSLIQGGAIALAFGSPLILLYVLIGALLWNFTARPWEEHDMEERFGDSFRHYRAHVRCWLPRIFPYSPP